MDDAPAAFPAAPPRLCVLASGSAGNCTVLIVGETSPRPRVILIDAGLSPRRTGRLLERLGLGLDAVDDVVITHLDHDHFHPGWPSALPPRSTVRMHRRHLGRAARDGLLHHRTEPFDADFTAGPARFSTALLEHDSLGVVAFRVEFDDAGTLGFATDVGRPTPRLIDHLRGVDVLAIESNYCPRLQAASPRPEFLKARIMGGAGHLSNAQCAQAAREIRPARHVVLLHLSRDCNRPDLAALGHHGAGYQVTISSQLEPTPWISVAGVPRKPAVRLAERPDRPLTGRMPAQQLLFR